MAENNALKFYKGWYGKGDARNLPDSPSAIIFNEEEGLVYVNGKAYGGASDVTFADNTLTITYTDGRPSVALDFSDTASASETLELFERLEAIVGVSVVGGDSDSERALDYDGTNYLDGAETLVDADRTMDTVVKTVEDRVENLEQQAEGLAEYTWVEEHYRNKEDDVPATEVTYDDTNTEMGSQSAAVDTVQKAVEAIDSRLKELEAPNSFDTIVSSDETDTPDGVVWYNDESDDTVIGTLEASESTMHIVYLVKVTDSSDLTDIYDEYISIRNGNTYSWTRIGSTRNELRGYVKTIAVNGKDYTVNGNTTKVVLGDSVTAVTGESSVELNETSFVNVKAVTTTNAADGSRETSITSSVKTVSIDNAEEAGQGTDAVDGLATALDVRRKIESLDADKEDRDSKGNVTVSLTETDGVITSLGVDVTYATVTKTDGTNGSDTTLVVASGDEDRLVIGSDVTKLASFTNTRIAEEIAKLNSDVTSSGSENVPVEVSLTQFEGLVTDMHVQVLGADVTFDGSGSDETLDITNTDGVVLGSDIVHLKRYIDTKFLNDGTTVTNSNGSNDALSVVASTDTQGNKNYDINIVWSEFSGSNGN